MIPVLGKSIRVSADELFEKEEIAYSRTSQIWQAGFQLYENYYLLFGQEKAFYFWNFHLLRLVDSRGSTLPQECLVSRT